MATRINKYLSEVGYCSRREADRLIEKSKIKINGKIAVLGDQVEDTDQVTVDGKNIKADHDFVYIAFKQTRWYYFYY